MRGGAALAGVVAEGLFLASVPQGSRIMARELF